MSLYVHWAIHDYYSFFLFKKCTHAYPMCNRSCMINNNSLVRTTSIMCIRSNEQQDWAGATAQVYVRATSYLARSSIVAPCTIIMAAASCTIRRRRGRVVCVLMRDVYRSVMTKIKRAIRDLIPCHTRRRRTQTAGGQRSGKPCD